MDWLLSLIRELGLLPADRLYVLLLYAGFVVIVYKCLKQ